MHGLIVPVNEALGSKPGYAKIVKGERKNQGASRVIYATDSNHKDIHVTTLDRELSNKSIGDVTLVKIDVEGGELEVLIGATRTISKHKPILCGNT